MAGQRADGAGHVRLISVAAGMRDFGKRCAGSHDHAPGAAGTGLRAIGRGIDAVELAKLARERFADEAMPRAPFADAGDAFDGEVGGQPVRWLMLVLCGRVDLFQKERGRTPEIDRRRTNQLIGIGHRPADGQCRA